MKITESQLRKIIQEETTTTKFQQLMEQRADERLQDLNNPELLNEASITWGDLDIQVDFAKWAAVSGVTTTVCATAITIASMFAGWEGVAIVLIPALAALAANPIVVAIAGGIALKFKPVRKALMWLFKKLGGKTVEKVSNTVQQIIDKMVEKSGGKLSRENAMELYGMIAKFVASNSEFRSKIKKLVRAMMKNNQADIAVISSELDDLVERIIKREILGISESEEIDIDGAPEEELEEPMIAAGETGEVGETVYAKESRIRLTQSTLRKIIQEEVAKLREHEDAEFEPITIRAVNETSGDVVVMTWPQAPSESTVLKTLAGTYAMDVVDGFEIDSGEGWLNANIRDSDVRRALGLRVTSDEDELSRDIEMGLTK